MHQTYGRVFVLQYKCIAKNNSQHRATSKDQEDRQQSAKGGGGGGSVSHPAKHCPCNLAMHIMILSCVLLQTSGQICHPGDVFAGVWHGPLIGSHLVDQGFTLHCKNPPLGEVQLAHEHQVAQLLLCQNQQALQEQQQLSEVGMCLSRGLTGTKLCKEEMTSSGVQEPCLLMALMSASKKVQRMGTSSELCLLCASKRQATGTMTA